MFDATKQFSIYTTRVEVIAAAPPVSTAELPCRGKVGGGGGEGGGRGRGGRLQSNTTMSPHPHRVFGGFADALMDESMTPSCWAALGSCWAQLSRAMQCWAPNCHLDHSRG